jgi:hypothetical protein
LPHKSLKQFAQQAQISSTRAWSVTKKLHLLLYKMRQVSVTADGDCKRMHFCNWFLWAVHDSFLDPKLTFFIAKAWFHLSGHMNAHNNRYWSSINLKQISEVLLHEQKFSALCAITAARIVGSIFF